MCTLPKSPRVNPIADCVRHLAGGDISQHRPSIGGTAIRFVPSNRIRSRGAGKKCGGAASGGDVGHLGGSGHTPAQGCRTQVGEKLRGSCCIGFRVRDREVTSDCGPHGLLLESQKCVCMFGHFYHFVADQRPPVPATRGFMRLQHVNS